MPIYVLVMSSGLGGGSDDKVLFGKEVLASGHGLIGSLVEEFELSSRVSPLNEETIAG